MQSKSINIYTNSSMNKDELSKLSKDELISMLLAQQGTENTVQTNGTKFNVKPIKSLKSLTELAANQ